MFCSLSDCKCVGLLTIRCVLVSAVVRWREQSCSRGRDDPRAGGSDAVGVSGGGGQGLAGEFRGLQCHQTGLRSHQQVRGQRSHTEWALYSTAMGEFPVITLALFFSGLLVWTGCRSLWPGGTCTSASSLRPETPWAWTCCQRCVWWSRDYSFWGQEFTQHLNFLPEPICNRCSCSLLNALLYLPQDVFSDTIIGKLISINNIIAFSELLHSILTFFTSSVGFSCIKLTLIIYLWSNQSWNKMTII